MSVIFVISLFLAIIIMVGLGVIHFESNWLKRLIGAYHRWLNRLGSK